MRVTQRPSRAKGSNLYNKFLDSQSKNHKQNTFWTRMWEISLTQSRLITNNNRVVTIIQVSKVSHLTNRQLKETRKVTEWENSSKGSDRKIKTTKTIIVSRKFKNYKKPNCPSSLTWLSPATTVGWSSTKRTLSTNTVAKFTLFSSSTTTLSTWSNSSPFWPSVLNSNRPKSLHKETKISCCNKKSPCTKSL